MAGSPLEVTSIAERVYGALRERILTGELPPNARLHQEALSAQLGVSRTPLREALGRLAADGLVEMLPNRGARVADVGPEDMACAYEARLVVEPAAAALAAARADGAAVETIRSAIAAHRASVDDAGEAFRANRAFHLAVVAAAGNPYLLRFAETLWAGRVGMRVYEEQRDSAGFIAADADEHGAIADAIERGDEADAERLMRDHIVRARADLLDHLPAVAAPA